ncbi:MAG TPA: 7TM diverse intracellular signaling domain-containing protein, partial [Chitinophagaceae bacterium]|nr:7TM diverse intracellular signaling domain-containing protein [Chitinophagaceae bacterium]
MVKFLVAALGWCLLIFANQTYGQVVLAENGQEDIIVNPYAYIFKDRSAGIHDISKVIAAPDSAFIKNSYYQEVHYGFFQPSGWCRFTIQNLSDNTDWILKVHQSRVDTVQLYVQRQNGELIKYPLTGHFQAIEDRAFHSMSFAHPLSFAKNETVVCYLFTQRKFARHAAILSFQTQDYHKGYDTKLLILISALMGICILSSVIGIVMFVVLRERVYMSYSIYCFSFLLLIAVDTGFMYAFVNAPVQQKLINNFSIILYYWIAGWHTLFTIELLKLNRIRQRWMYWLGIGSGLLFCSAALFLLFPIPDIARKYISMWSYYILFFLDVYILYALILQWIRKEVVVFFYVGGFLFTIFAASLAMLADLQIIEGVNHRTDMLFIAPVVEIICMVIGLGINSNNYVKDRLKAQRQIITVQEDERKRIGQDLHDDVGNSLAAVKNMLAQQRDPLLIEKEIDDIIQDVRNISHDLMPVDFKEYALADIVRQTVNKFKNYPGIQFEYSQTGPVVKLHPVAELMLYRIIN